MNQPGLERARIGRDAISVALLMLAAGGVYAATAQRWLWNDGFGIGPRLEWSPAAEWPHPLYLPVVRALAKLGAGPWPYGTLLMASWLPTVLTVGALYALSRARLARWPALFLCAAVALSPLVWYFATTIEVHALHGAAVACGCLALSRLPWQRPAWAVLLAGLCFVPAAASHLMALLLIPGWLALSREAAQGRRPLSKRWLFGGLLPLLGLIQLLVLWYSGARWWAAEPGLIGESEQAAGSRGGATAVVGQAIAGILKQIQRDARMDHGAWLRGDLFEPFGWVWAPVFLLLVLIGAWSGLRQPAQRARCLAWIVLAAPLLVFTALWAVPNRGGYLLGTLPALVLLAGEGYRWLAGWRGASVLLPLTLALSLVWPGQAQVLAWRTVYAAESRGERAQVVQRALGERGLLVSMDVERQPIGFDVPGVIEFNATQRFLEGLRAGRPAQALAQEIVGDLERLFAQGNRPAAVDLRYRAQGLADPNLARYVAAFDAELSRRFVFQEVASARWPLLLLIELRPLEER